MGSDLSLDLRYFAFKALRQTKDAPPSDMDACIRRLEEERGKIEMFKRELPLCARLLADGEKAFYPKFSSSSSSFFTRRAFPCRRCLLMLALRFLHLQ